MQKKMFHKKEKQRKRNSESGWNLRIVHITEELGEQ